MISATLPPPASRREEEFVLVALGSLFLITAASWALAFWPVQQSTGWIARTRYACFGVASNGLPDGGGWVALIGGPIGMIMILIAGWSRGLMALMQRARTSRSIATALTALALGTVVLLGGAALRVLQARSANAPLNEVDIVSAADYSRLDRAPPALSLTAQSGEPFDIASLRGRTVLLTFGYAHCETVCPLVVQRVLSVQRHIADLAVVIVTLDPWRDTPSRLPSIAELWRLPAHDAWILSGGVESVNAALDAWQVPRVRDPRTGEVTHPGLVYILDAEGRIAFTANAPAVETMVQLTRRTIEEAGGR